MVHLAFLFYNFLCLGRLQNSWTIFHSFSTKFFNLVRISRFSPIRIFKNEQVQSLQKRKQAKGIIQVLRKTKLDPDKDPAHLEAILYLYSRLSEQKFMMKKKNLPQQRFSELEEEIEGIEIILFKLIPKDFIKKLETGYYLKLP